MKSFKLLLCLFLLLGSNIQFFQAQTFGNGNLGIVNIGSPNQIVNSYYAVSSINSNTINLNSTPPNLNGKRILIIQMEGSSAGTWEWCRVNSSTGITVSVSSPLTNTYFPSQKVQIVVVPEYEYLNIFSSSSLTCSPYNPTTGTGGILAFNVKEEFTIINGGICTVVGKGYAGGQGGSGGVAGAGGQGGLAGLTNGQNGGDSGVQLNTGIFGGGNGGSYGSFGTNGSSATTPFGLGSGSPASNLSQMQNIPPMILLGGAGTGGNGGNGKAGAGGGGGGAGIGAQNGTNGAAGTFGGNGGIGGNGGGIILFTAKDLIINSSTPVFLVGGTNGTAATNGQIAGNGGNGGLGQNCSTAGGGGGGRGGDGGNGGNGGSGGAGGTVYGILAPTSTTSEITASHVSLIGGNGGNGGTGGGNGFGGLNGGQIGGFSCIPTIATPGLGTCSLEETLSILEQMGINGTNNAVYTFSNGTHRWATPNGSYFVEMIEVYPGQNQGYWRINGVGPNGAFFAFLEGSPSYNLFQALDNLVNLNNVVTYTSTANSQIGELTNYSETFTSVCSYLQVNAEDGTPGTPGQPGSNSNAGQFGSGSPDCDPANLTYEITNVGNGSDDFVLDFPSGLTFNGELFSDGWPTQITSNSQVVIPVNNELYIMLYGELFDECGNSVIVEWYIDFPPQPCSVDFQYSIQNATCTNPQAIVTIDVTINPGSNGLIYDWSDYGTNDSQSGNFFSYFQVVRSLNPGNYDFQVSDYYNNCFGNLSITIDEPQVTELSLNTTISQPSCLVSYGTIQANASMGTAPYTYTLNGSTTSTTGTFSGLNPGSYTIEVIDANGCYTVNSNTIIINGFSSNLILNQVTTQPTCSNPSGTITALISGGVAPYSYSLNGQTPTSNSTFSNLLAGNYIITVIDAFGCSVSSEQITINTFESGIELTHTIINPVCSSDLGSIETNVIGGLNPYSFYINGQLNANSIFTNLNPGQYSIEVVDGNNCSVSENVSVNAPSSLIVNANVIQPVCYRTLGSITMNTSGGTAPYLYDFGQGFTSNNSISTNPGATYNVTVTDANNCSSQTQYIMANPAPLSLSAVSSSINCFGACNGSIILANPSFNLASINWNPSNNPNALSQTGLCAGTYTVIATSDLGCTVTQSYTLTQPKQMEINLLYANNNPCFTSQAGDIKVEVVGGAAPLTYAWSNGGTTNYINNLAIGTYTLTVTDATGCTHTFQHTITSPPAITLNISGNLTYCHGASTAITVNPSGGIAPYFGGGTFLISEDTTEFKVQDANGCLVIETITLTELPSPEFEISSTNTCKNEMLGTAIVTPINANQPVTYLWSNAATTQTISNLESGLYTVTITDSNGCSSTYDTTVINAELSINSTIVDPSCMPSTNGSIQLTVTQNNNSNLTYLWNTGATTSQLTNLGAGNYSVIVTNEIGCEFENNFQLTNDCDCPLNFNVDICGPTVVCQGESFTLTSNVFPRPQGYPYTYSWTTPLGNIVNTANLSVTGAAITASGWYTLTVSLPPNCTYITQVYVTVRPRPIATISNAITGNVDNYIHMRSCDIDLTATGGVYYNWVIASTPMLTNHTNQLIHPTSASTASTVIFKVVAIDSFGCASLQVQHRVRTANPVISRSINNMSSNPTIIRTLTMNQTTQFAGATYTWSSNSWNPGSLPTALRQRTGTISQLAGIYTLVINQNGCERTFQFELLNNATFTPTIEVGTNKMNFNEEIETIETEDLFQIKAFPNPVTDQLQFEFENPNNEDIGLIILDNNGRILTDLNVGTDQKNVTIDVSSFAPGMYFVQCTRDSTIHREKIKIIKE